MSSNPLADLLWHKDYREADLPGLRRARALFRRFPPKYDASPRGYARSIYSHAMDAVDQRAWEIMPDRAAFYVCPEFEALKDRLRQEYADQIADLIGEKVPT